MVADLLRWLSDRNLDWFKADRQRTLEWYMEVLSILSIQSSPTAKMRPYLINTLGAPS